MIHCLMTKISGIQLLGPRAKKHIRRQLPAYVLFIIKSKNSYSHNAVHSLELCYGSLVGSARHVKHGERNVSS